METTITKYPKPKTANNGINKAIINDKINRKLNHPHNADNKGLALWSISTMSSQPQSSLNKNLKTSPNVPSNPTTQPLNQTPNHSKNNSTKFKNKKISSNKTIQITTIWHSISSLNKAGGNKNENPKKRKQENQLPHKQSTCLFHFKQTNNWYLYLPNSKHKSQENIINKHRNFDILNNVHIPWNYQFKVFKYNNMPECLISNCNAYNIPLIEDRDNCNIIWKLYEQNQLKECIQKLTKYQKFNHFSTTYQLGCKDNLHINYKNFKKNFPKEYAFMPQSYTLPGEYNYFIKEYQTKKCKWIVKPVNSSRGRGIRILRNDEVHWLKSKNYSAQISKYISNPDLINNKKYDLRIYVLVTSFTPLKIYWYHNGLVRFATEDYKEGDYDNIYIHLTNYSINKSNLNFKENENVPERKGYPAKPKDEAHNDIDSSVINDGDDEDSSKWSFDQYRKHFMNLGKESVFHTLWIGIKDIIIKTIITISGKTNNQTPLNRRNNIFELFGFDIMVNNKYKPKWIEVNTNPSLQCTSPLDKAIKSDLIADVFSIVGIIPMNHHNNNERLKYVNIKTEMKETDAARTLRGGQWKCDDEEYIDKGDWLVSKRILGEFNRNNLVGKNENYSMPYYKKMIGEYLEEVERSKETDFEMIFPVKETLDDYVNYLVYDGNNDNNIVWWQYILSQNNVEYEHCGNSEAESKENE